MNKSILYPTRVRSLDQSMSLWLRPLVTIMGALLYTLLFARSAGTGINVVLFDIALLFGSRWLDPEQWRNNFTWLSGWGLLLSGICIVLVHSEWARVIHYLYFVVFIGYVQRRELRFLLFGGLLGLWSLGTAVFPFLRNTFRSLRPESIFLTNVPNFWLLLLPLFIIIPFYLLYFQANPAFAEFFQRVYQLFSFDFRLDVVGWFYFIIGMILSSAVFYKGLQFGNQWSLPHNFTFDLTRMRKKPTTRWTKKNTILALKREYQIALISLLALNALLLVANIADLRFLWFDFSDKSPAELSQYVHAGTWSLISSIVLAMVMLLVFFRQNLNFYPGNELLRKLAYVWLVQNAWLALGVGLRNGFYIHHYGLAQGRIVVVVFLVLVLLGLWTLYFKIARRKTLYFVLQSNGWAAMIALLLTAAINWDVMISRYNIGVETKEAIDLVQLERLLSDKNTFLLIKHREKLYGKYSSTPIDSEFLTERRWIKYRLNSKRYQNNWLTWNWPDERNRRALKRFLQ